ncbi:DnaB-like helicase N-terminal domain-containing protein [Bacillus salacetis]|uniref:DnaB-like helicase N-terminal domain-containing protein n=1 Tax=Bacillus salacetis TaxID=2315464 RepID=UPI0023E89169|nr:DnaB-like helicase N-terminal domain-containing protein [Bacillus salacetis]
MQKESREAGRHSIPHDMAGNLLNQELFEAESMLLGAVFLEPASINDMTLKPEHFYQARNRLIFEKMRELQREGIEINPFSIVHRTGKDIENIGGVTYITELSLCCPSVSGMEHYQSVIMENYRLRELKKSAVRFLNEPTTDRADALYQTYVETQEMGLAGGESKGDTLADIFESFYSDPVHGGITSGYEKLDSMTGGFKPGELIIVAGRPSMGKTALVVNLAYMQ